MVAEQASALAAVQQAKSVQASAAPLLSGLSFFLAWHLANASSPVPEHAQAGPSSSAITDPYCPKQIAACMFSM